jgi:hypothetical protein
MTTKRKAKAKKELFKNRVRFNWGYHDAAQCVREGWTETGRCFGDNGPLSRATTPEEVLRYHFDASYANGWAAGYRDARAGVYANNSQSAWEEALAAGWVSE